MDFPLTFVIKRLVPVDAAGEDARRPLQQVSGPGVAGAGRTE